MTTLQIIAKQMNMVFFGLENKITGELILWATGIYRYLIVCFALSFSVLIAYIIQGGVHKLQHI